MNKLVKYTEYTDSLFEGGSEMQIDEFKSAYSKKCKNHSDSNTKLFRGVNANLPIIYYKPHSNKRKSIDIKNFYTLLTSNLPSWKDFPKRSEAVIASGLYDYAERYKGSGFVYILVPSDDANFGLAPTFDVYHAYTKWFKKWKLEDFPEFVEGIGEAYEEMTGKALNDSSWTTFAKQTKIFDDLDELQEVVVEEGLIAAYFFLEFIGSGEQSWLSWMDKKFDPYKTGFDIKPYKSKFKIDPNTEAWTADECWLIREDIYKQLLKTGVISK